MQCVTMQKEKEDAEESLKKLQVESQQAVASSSALQAANEQLRSTVQDLEAKVPHPCPAPLSLHAPPLPSARASRCMHGGFIVGKRQPPPEYGPPCMTTVTSACITSVMQLEPT